MAEKSQAMVAAGPMQLHRVLCLGSASLVLGESGHTFGSVPSPAGAPCSKLDHAAARLGSLQPCDTLSDVAVDACVALVRAMARPMQVGWQLPPPPPPAAALLKIPCSTPSQPVLFLA